MRPDDARGGGDTTLMEQALKQTLELALEQALDLRETLQDLPDPNLEALIDVILLELGRRSTTAP